MRKLLCEICTCKLSSQPFEIGIQVNQSAILAADRGSWRRTGAEWSHRGPSMCVCPWHCPLRLIIWNWWFLTTAFYVNVSNFSFWLFIDEWVSFIKQFLYSTFQALGVYHQLNVNHLGTCVSIEKPTTWACLTLIMKLSGMQLVHIQASGTLVNNLDPGACVCVQLVMFSFSWLASSALQTR